MQYHHLTTTTSSGLHTPTFSGLKMYILKTQHSRPAFNINLWKRIDQCLPACKHTFVDSKLTISTSPSKQPKMMQTGKFSNMFSPVYSAHDCSRCHFLTIWFDFLSFYCRNPKFDLFLPILTFQSNNDAKATNIRTFWVYSKSFKRCSAVPTRPFANNQSRFASPTSSHLPKVLNPTMPESQQVFRCSN